MSQAMFLVEPSFPARLYPRAARWVSHQRMTLATTGAVALALASGYLAGIAPPAVPAALLVGASAAIGALRYPKVAVGLVVAVVALLPFGVIPVRLGVAPTFLDLATVILWATWFARVATGRDRLRHPAVLAAFGLFVALSVVAFIGSPDPIAPNETARTFAKVMVSTLIVVPISHLARDRATGIMVAATIVVTAALESVIGLALYVVPRDLAYRALVALEPLGYPTGDGILRYRPETDILRAIGTSIDPNMLGAMLMVSSSIGVAVLLAPRPPWPRSVTVGALGPIFACLLLTESRGSWLSFGVAVAVVAALRHRRLWLVALLSAFAVPFVPAAQRFTEHLISGLQAQDRAASMRLGEISNAVTIIGSAPWIGVGWGVGERSIDLEFTRGVSNIYLAIAQRSGIPALSAYVAAWVTTAGAIWSGLITSLRDRADDGITLGSAAAVVGALASGMLDHHFVSFPHLVTLLGTVTGVLVARTTGHHSGKEAVALATYPSVTAPSRASP
jgi:hypothetical protein